MERNFIISAVLMVSGVFLRFGAYSIAWPNKCSYSCSREETIWAVREAALSEIAVAIFVIGGVLFVGALLIAQFRAQN